MTSSDPGDRRVQDGGASDLRGRAARGGSIVLAVQLVQQALRLVLLAVMARLLTPEDYGLLGMVLAFTALLATFQDLGLSAATVQRKHLTEAQLSAVFWLNVALGAAMTLLFAASAPAVAWFYDEPVLVLVTVAVACGFFLASLGAQSAALLDRRMDFASVALAELVGLVAGGAAGIAGAMHGYGVFALVAQRLVHTTVTMCVYVARARWRPGRPRRVAGVREMVGFGGYLTGFNVLNYFTRNFDKVLLGRFWGAAELGLYTRSYMLMTLPIQLVSWPMARALRPALSRLQDDEKRFADASVSALHLLTWASFPMAGGLAVLAEETISLVYGEQWLGAVPVYRVLCIAGLLQTLLNVSGTFFVARGKTREFFRWGIFASTATVVGFVPCIWYGGIGAAIGYTVVVYATAPLLYGFIDRVIGIPLAAVWRTVVGPAVATGLMAALVWQLKLQLPVDWGLLVRVGVLVAAGVVTYLLLTPILAPAALREAKRAYRQARA
ncbi:MAG: lipopolysaccharide biosynthesis protein [Myxococcota bacterium]|nr:lipopolysaccharide biosynthesis protein [Myxococcota bacterium]